MRGVSVFPALNTVEAHEGGEILSLEPVGFTVGAHGQAAHVRFVTSSPVRHFDESLPQTAASSLSTPATAHDVRSVRVHQISPPLLNVSVGLFDAVCALVPPLPPSYTSLLVRSCIEGIPLYLLDTVRLTIYLQTTVAMVASPHAHAVPAFCHRRSARWQRWHGMIDESLQLAA